MTVDSEGFKRCSHCRREKPVAEFSKRKASKDGLSYNCKICEREIATASYKRQKQKKKAHQRYLDNREEHLERSAQNYQENRETRLAQSKAYREANPEVARKSGKKRRDLMRANRGKPYTREEIIERDSEDGILICQICGKPIEDLSQLEIDHIIPINQGGKDCYDNVRAAHKTCNISRPKDGRDL